MNPKFASRVKPLPPVKQTTFTTGLRENMAEVVKEFTDKVKKNLRYCKEKKISIFLQNRYLCSTLNPGVLKGVDKLWYEGLKNSVDIELTPVLCFAGGFRMSDMFTEESQTELFGEKTVYAFTMKDLEGLKNTLRPKQKIKQDQIYFLGFNNEAEVLLNHMKTMSLTLFEPGRNIRWSYQCAMIVSAQRKDSVGIKIVDKASKKQRQSERNHAKEDESEVAAASNAKVEGKDVGRVRVN